MSIVFAVACKRFFDKREGQTLQQFASELSDLSYEAKLELAELLSKELGEEVTVVKD